MSPTVTVSEEIALCPNCSSFCWAGATHKARTTAVDWQVDCSEECGYVGPVRDSRLKAILAHNDRATRIKAIMQED